MNGLFCYWKLVEGKGKIPYNPITNLLAKSNDSRTFCNYALLCKYTQNLEFDNKTNGIGLGIFNEIIIDGNNGDNQIFIIR